MTRVLIASPPVAAVGGVATHTRLVLENAPQARLFNQWWPLAERSESAPVRYGIHALGLLRWLVRLSLDRPDVVHLQVSGPGIRRDVAYLRMARRWGLPVVAHVHTAGFFDGTSAAADSGMAEIVRSASRVIVMSERAARQIRGGVGPGGAEVVAIPNPVPNRPSRRSALATGGRGSRPVRLLTVGEIGALKNQAAVVRAIVPLAAAGLDVIYDLVGPWGSMPEEDAQLIRSTANVRIHGVLRGPELTAMYDGADIFVLWSHSEAEPFSMLEAMAAGLPVIASAVGSVPDTLQNVAGNVILPVTDMAGLSLAIEELVRNSETRARVGGANQVWVLANRSLEGHLSALLSIFDSMAAPR